MTEQNPTQTKPQSIPFPVRGGVSLFASNRLMLKIKIFIVQVVAVITPLKAIILTLLLGGALMIQPNKPKCFMKRMRIKIRPGIIGSPTFQNLFGSKVKSPKVLSLGCGTGADIDILCNEGFNGVGIDCGNRTWAWPRREHKDRFFVS